MSDIWLSLGTVVFAYLIGSIPAGYIIVRLRTRKDLRSVGTGNVGAYNVLKQMGAAASVLVTLLDMGKGMAGFKLADWVGAPEGIGPICAAAVIIGHVYPLFLSFKGGTGVAPGLGIATVVTPLYAAISFLIGLIFGLPKKSPPIGIFVGLIVLNVSVLISRKPQSMILTIGVVTLLIVAAHLLKKYRQVRAGLKTANLKELF